ncbi:hypothetical protein CYY_007461 [Polysphondylium violaceum]|uniref:MoaB/Mog domain-containing protein n=1 Tax=Polysphondylium violaceum TaxID=133409 RepID=A0A8J4PQF1_9MYCE|nr:hypothetical protein CYY_007461 [Polysphondylium violaceum]
MSSYQIGVLTVSDTCARGEATDQSGPEIISMIKSHYKALMGKSGENITINTTYKVVPDEVEHIQSLVVQWVHQGYKLILTTGGTGFTPRDVTPEAIKPLIEKRCKGIEIAMLKTSLDVTPHAMLSRPVAGIKSNTLIVTLPGSVKAVRENLAAILPAVPHAIGLINSAPKASTTSEHRSKDYSSNSNSTVTSISSDGCRGHHGHSHSHNHSHQEEKPHSCGDGVHRKRVSPYPMINVDDAIDIILKQCDLLDIGTEMKPITEALGRLLAEDIHSVEPFPPFRASIKDGYAVRSKDGVGKYKILGDSLAGSSSYDPQLLAAQDPKEKYCVVITTGAKIPDEFDAVVMVENTELIADEKDHVSILSSVAVGEDIRPVGSDIPAQSLVLKKGAKIGCAEVGLLATLGLVQVSVHKLPSVSIISTGDELVDYQTKQIPSGMIRDSNSPTLASIIQELNSHFGECASRENIHLHGIVKDKVEDLERVFKDAAARSDIIITSGGVSMGQLDLVKPLLEKMGKLQFGRVNMKPGKPLTFSTITTASDSTANKNKTTLVFSLPGNPVSTVVTFYLFVVPALRKLSGFSNYNLPMVEVKLNDRLRLDPERPEYHRVTIEWDFNQHCFISTSTGSQASCRLLSLKNANALLLLPKSEGYQEKGSMVKAIVIGPLHN